MKTIFIIVFLFTGSLYSQNIEWENVYPNQLTVGKALAVDADDNIISVGNGLNVAAFNEYIYVEKLNPQGNVIWKDSISTIVNNNYHSATWVGLNSNNDIYIVGYRFTLSNQNDIPNAIKVIKYSSNGILEQNITIPGVFNRDGNINLGRRNEAMIDENDNLYVATAGGTDTQSNVGFVLLKFDSNINLLWERQQNFSNVHGLRGMHYNNGKIALVGTSTISGLDNKVAVWDENGNLQWASNSSVPGQTWATDILIDNFGNSYTLCQNFGTSHNLTELTKYNPSGTVLYSQSFDLQIASTSGRMAFLPNNNIAISSTNWTSSGTGKLFVAQISAQDGNIVNSSTHDLPQINNWVYDIATSTNGNYYIVGQSDNNGGSPADMFLYAFSTNNGYEWNALYSTQGVKPMSISFDSSQNLYVQIQNNNTVVKFGNSLLSIPEQSLGQTIQFYPNPIQDYLNIKTNKNIEHLVLLDVNGKIILETDLSTQNVYLGNLNTGLYIVVLSTKEGNIYRFKIIKK